MSDSNGRLKPEDIPIVDSMEEYFSYTQPNGSMTRAMSEHLYGINKTTVESALPRPRDQQGFTFFTRPQLNLSRDNVRAYRKFYSMLTKEPYSMHRYIRTMLDPRLTQEGIYGANSDNLKSPLANNDFAFVPIMTNSLKNMSGWPDLVLPTYTSSQGSHRQQTSQADGVIDNYEVFDIDATFNNISGSPIINMMHIWTLYMSAVFEGTMMPYMDFISEQEYDYNTRIYRLVTDESRTRLTNISATGASFPLTNPMGQVFDFNKETVFSQQSKEFTIRFRCMGAQYQDDILIKEFNDTVNMFSAEMFQNAAVIESGQNPSYSFMVKIPKTDKHRNFFRNKGYPRINPETYEIEWWIPRTWV